MTDKTPYYSRPAKERAREAACMRHVLAGAEAPDVIVESFGGIGMTAQIMRDFWPGASIYSSDLDTACAQEWNAKLQTQNPLRYCDNDDALSVLQKLAPTIQPPQKVGVSLDFNRLTLLDLEKGREDDWRLELIGEVLELRPSWIQVTDSACSKLHLNWRSYGLERPGFIDYINKLDEWWQQRTKYKMMAVARHHAASYYRLEALTHGERLRPWLLHYDGQETGVTVYGRQL